MRIEIAFYNFWGEKLIEQVENLKAKAYRIRKTEFVWTKAWENFDRYSMIVDKI